MKTRYVVYGIVQKGTHLVLGRKHQFSAYPGQWVIPGGGCEDQAKAAKLLGRTDYDNPYFHDELRRELAEETGIKVGNIRCLSPGYLKEPLEAQIPDKHGVMTHHYYLFYVCDYVSGEVKAADDLAEAKWVKREDLDSYALSKPTKEALNSYGWLVYRNARGQVTSPLDYINLWGLMGTVGWQTAGPLLILGIGGVLLDRKLHTAPFLMLLGIAASIAVSYVLVRGTVRRMQAMASAKARQSKEANSRK